MSCNNIKRESAAVVWVATAAGFAQDLKAVKAKLMGICLARANGDHAEAEESYSETTETLWKFYFRKFDGANFGAWATRVCVNCCTDVYRRRRRRMEFETLDMVQNEADGSYFYRSTQYDEEESSPEDVLIAKETLRYMRKMIRAHCADPKRVALLIGCCLNDQSYKEMAEALDIPIGTVMSGLFRARQTMQEAFEKDGFTPSTYKL